MIVYLLLYIDDMLLIGKTISDIKDIKMSSSFELEMKDLGHAKRNFGMDIKKKG